MPDIQPLLELAVSDRDITLLKNACVKLDTMIKSCREELDQRLQEKEMWTGTFGTNKIDNTPHKFIVDGKNVEIYFSPSDQTTSKILEVINDVDYTFEFGLLSFTRNDLGQAVIDKDAQFGVNVRGIIEDENSTGSEFANLQANGVNVKSHMG